jgi:hypothetical protein
LVVDGFIVCWLDCIELVTVVWLLPSLVVGLTGDDDLETQLINNKNGIKKQAVNNGRVNLNISPFISVSSFF